MKRWSYKQITEQAEKAIKDHRRHAKEALEKGGLEFMVEYHDSAARGVCTFWYCLTIGWQQVGDHERLDKLSRGEGGS